MNKPKVINSLKALNASTAKEDVSKNDIYALAPHMIEEEEGFNSRGAFCDDYWEREDVKAEIASLADAYKRGDFVPPMIVKFVDGRAFVREGHRRLRALNLAIEQGAEIQKIQVLEHRGDEAEQTALILTANNGKPLTALEKAVVYGRLSSWGWSDKQIGDKVGLTSEKIRQDRALLELPLELKKMIQADVISASYGAELFAEHGTKAIDIINAAMVDNDSTDNAPQTEEKKTKRITRKQVEKGPRMTKKVVKSMHQSLQGLSAGLGDAVPEGEGYALKISKEVYEQLMELQETLGLAESDGEKPEKDQQDLFESEHPMNTENPAEKEAIPTVF
mgnify:CR=1 FL=1|tara:strand:+ start:3505 stop:4506 length:1002 start_codon:yes stop_codon:yes gene_type:complete